MSARLLAALLGTAAVGHAVTPQPFDALVPRWVPGPARFWTYASGVAEAAVAIAVAVPRTRRIGGWAAAALFVGVFPANVQMAVDWSDRSPRERAIAYGRLPLQVPLVLWALRVARRA
jgi:uncharacterized membrane protein